MRKSVHTEPGFLGTGLSKLLYAQYFAKPELLFFRILGYGIYSDF